MKVSAYKKVTIEIQDDKHCSCNCIFNTNTLNDDRLVEEFTGKKCILFNNKLLSYDKGFVRLQECIDHFHGAEHQCFEMTIERRYYKLYENGIAIV